jgi:hypothetical protein
MPGYGDPRYVPHSSPGTGDEPLSVAQIIGPPVGAIIVTTPQEVAVADVRRSITFYEELKIETAKCPRRKLHHQGANSSYHHPGILRRRPESAFLVLDRGWRLR